jgi:hypothetical protein
MMVALTLLALQREKGGCCAVDARAKLQSIKRSRVSFLIALVFEG